MTVQWWIPTVLGHQTILNISHQCHQATDPKISFHQVLFESFWICWSVILMSFCQCFRFHGHFTVILMWFCQCVGFRAHLNIIRSCHINVSLNHSRSSTSTRPFRARSLCTAPHVDTAPRSPRHTRPPCCPRPAPRSSAQRWSGRPNRLGCHLPHVMKDWCGFTLGEHPLVN